MLHHVFQSMVVFLYDSCTQNVFHPSQNSRLERLHKLWDMQLQLYLLLGCDSMDA